MCNSYRRFNKITINRKYPIHLITDLLDQLGKTLNLTKLNLRSGYYQVCITEEDEPKVECVRMYEYFVFLVMPFCLSNALATFWTLRNIMVLQLFLNYFVVVYLDDIVVYSTTLEQYP